MQTETLLVTGAGGHLGRRVVELLLERRPTPRVIAVTRSPDGLVDLAARGVDVRHGDFDDAAGLAAAFAGATRALLISTDAIARDGRRIRQHRTAIAALVAAGVRHVVYTSLPNADRSAVLIAPDHAATEAALADAPIDVTILRNNQYTDYLLMSLPTAVATGFLVDARGAGGIAYVTRDDCARAAAGALVTARGRATYEVSGPAAITRAELAAITSELVGRPVGERAVAAPELAASLAAHGLPAPIAELLASFDIAAAAGDFANVTAAVRELGGVEPTSVRSFLATQRAALVR